MCVKNSIVFIIICCFVMTKGMSQTKSPASYYSQRKTIIKKYTDSINTCMDSINTMHKREDSLPVRAYYSRIMRLSRDKAKRLSELNKEIHSNIRKPAAR